MQFTRVPCLIRHTGRWRTQDWMASVAVNRAGVHVTHHVAIDARVCERCAKFEVRTKPETLMESRPKSRELLAQSLDM